ncbi:putative Forkhead-associated protein [Syntrophobacter sp. SbD1]|nr:putative Forkhead-associated protein [Syntrophobacter sp. SbD1]
MYTCPKGHQSTDADYCSECGALIGQSSLAAAQAGDSTATTPTGNDICPDCGSPRNASNRYCEVCRYDFQSKSSYVVTTPGITPASAEPVQDASPPAPPVTSITIPATAASSTFAAAQRLNVEIIIDSTLVTDPEMAAKCPKDAPKRTFPLDLDENLVGRRSDTKGVYPEIEIEDSGASRRHLKLIRQSDGGYAALELGSANGTKLNGADLEPGIITPVKAGDEFVIGMWTRLRITQR